MSNDKALAVTTSTSTQAIAHFGEMSVQAVIDRKRKIVEVMKAVMRDGDHYGTIPGCGDKPALLKAGAETLAMTFGLRPTFQIERVDLPGGHREYQVICTLAHIASGLAVAEGLGSATTLESKHRWRNAARVCPHCRKETIIKGKEEWGGGWLCFQKKGGCGAKWQDGAKEIEGQVVGRVENTDPADQYNTVLKMAKKRAQVDATLTAVGASDVLSQDLDDLPPGSEPDEFVDAEFVEVKPIARPQPASPARTTAAPAADPPAPGSGAPVQAPVKPMSEDDIIELITAMGQCGSEQALKQVGKRIPYGTVDAPTRERFARAYEAQLQDIRAAVAVESAP
jgi:hypothetical protein